MEEVKLYEAGVRLESGKYCQFIQSREEKEVDDYIYIMKQTKLEGSEIVKYIKLFRCVDVTPFIVG